MSFSSDTAIIGGSGFYQLTVDRNEAGNVYLAEIDTPYSEAPVKLYGETVGGLPLWFLPRHGESHAIPPHAINYRANIRALKDCGVKRIIAVNAVGGIAPEMEPGVIVLPDQIIDYTWGREHSYFDGLGSLHDHIDFTWPYDTRLVNLLADHALQLDITTVNRGVYGCTQGPRLETAAEIRRLARDGCDIVGMTGMPEASLARELGIAYACMALVVNRAAGLTDREISLADIETTLHGGLEDVRRIIFASLEDIV